MLAVPPDQSVEMSAHGHVGVVLTEASEDDDCGSGDGPLDLIGQFQPSYGFHLSVDKITVSQGTHALVLSIFASQLRVYEFEY